MEDFFLGLLFIVAIAAVLFGLFCLFAGLDGQRWTKISDDCYINKTIDRQIFHKDVTTRETFCKANLVQDGSR